MKAYPYQITSMEEYHNAYQQSLDDPEKFWQEIAGHFRWKKKPLEGLSWNFADPDIKWFADGELNITDNCLDRHAETQPDAIAIIWESNHPEEPSVKITYHELLTRVQEFAHVLQQHHIEKGDRICIYMPMVPELTIAMLACARIGAIHSVVFGGFSAQSIADRINDASCRLAITADGGFRGDKVIPLKEIMDEALVQCHSVECVIVLTRTRKPISMLKGRDVWWEDEVASVVASGKSAFESVCVNAEDPLFILYTSGSTGKPKGVVHSCAGYMIYTHYSFVNVFQYQPSDVYFCTADIGWITGHSYMVYGPLSAGATMLMFEGIPTWPDAGRLWEIVAKHHVAILYTAPTAIRSLMSFGLSWIEQKNLSSLKVLGSVGEPINEEAWQWFHKHIGKGNCPIVDTWWQTETGGILVSNLAGVTPQKPGFATLPLPGIQLALMNEQGEVISGSDSCFDVLPSSPISGNLVVKFPWPSIIRTTYGDHERCRSTYFAVYPGYYFTSDGCLRDTEGNYRITGRVDDVINISGHRIGTAEVENAINMHSGVIECAVIGYPHDIKGQGIYAFVIYQGNLHEPQLVREDIGKTVTKIIGALAKPDKIQFVDGLPKTRSGKIMRRILRKIAENNLDQLGDQTTLLDPLVVQSIINGRLR
jgi:acetyl-CoA synthetase